ncbi:MAG TPA: hypothetical protein VHZ74_13935, partial [Bryobacteraceae bacterium]|nr:hypothetical protein [Bryobacteraceae bacterium]
LERDVIQALESIVDYIRLFAEDIAECHLREYFEHSKESQKNNAIPDRVWRRVLALTAELWDGYVATLMFEPSARRARREMAIAEREFNELIAIPSTASVPHQEAWTLIWRRLESGPIQQMAATYLKTVQATMVRKVAEYRTRVAAPAGISDTAAQPKEELDVIDGFATTDQRKRAIEAFRTARGGILVKHAAANCGVSYEDLNKWKLHRGEKFAKGDSDKTRRIESTLRESAT